MRRPMYVLMFDIQYHLFAADMYTIITYRINILTAECMICLI